MEKEQRHIKEFEQLRSIAGSNLNILEEEIDIQVQKEYFSLLRQLGKQPEIYTQLTKEYIENINNHPLNHSKSVSLLGEQNYRYCHDIRPI